MRVCVWSSFWTPSRISSAEEDTKMSALFEKSSVDAARATPREGPALTSPLGGFLARLGVAGGPEFINRVAGGECTNGSSRCTYYQPEAGAPLQRAESSHSNAVAGSKRPSGPPSTPAGPASARKPTPKRRSAAAEAHAAAAAARKERIREREAAQAALEHQRQSESVRAASSEAAAAIAERKKRIEDRKAAVANAGTDGGSSEGGLSSARGGGKRARLSEHEQSSLRAHDRLRVEQMQRMQEAERSDKEKARESQMQRAQQQAIKKREQEEAAERKNAALREKAEARQRQNEAKRERARLAKLEQIARHKEKSAVTMAKANRDPSNEWWCDVAEDGCERPVKGVYEPSRYYCCGIDYIVCESCFEAHLTPEQQEELTIVDR